MQTEVSEQSSIDLEAVEDLTERYVFALRSAVQQASFVSGTRKEGGLVFSYFDQLLTRAAAKTGEEIVKEVTGRRKEGGR